MITQSFNWTSFGLRLLFAFVLVFASFNPSGYSYFHWAKHIFPSINPYIALCGVLLTIGWAIYLNATLRSLGFIGVVLALLFMACLVWIFVDLGWFNWQNMNGMAWVGLIIISVILAVGISWSHIRRRMTGQVDTDDIDDKH
ncbi:MAG: DUF6524 family protein [Marinagarivorans sp.]|nr:DUF6524 family protein [Marinagarivorans sp.]